MKEGFAPLQESFLGKTPPSSQVPIPPAEFGPQGWPSVVTRIMRDQILLEELRLVMKEGFAPLRIIFREEGILRTAMSRHCVSRTPDRTWSSEWPWCHEEWAGGDEGGMEVYTCYCQEELCNENSFLLAKFNEWISVTRARLKAGPSHPLDIVITIATVAVGGFFLLIILSQLPWAKLAGKKEEQVEEAEEDQSEEEGEEEEEEHVKSE